MHSVWTRTTVKSNRPYRDITGIKFGKLTAIKYSHKDKYRKTHWTCQCDCGRMIAPDRGSLVSGNTTSCGCTRGLHLKTHGCSLGKRTPEYNSWACMKQRCDNPKNPNYKYYGERGIKVCKRWKSFENFIEDMGVKPDQGMSIERINNNRGYCKSNCKWATAKEQSNNKRNNIKR